MKISEDNSKKIQILRGLAIIAVVFIHNTPNGMAQVFCRPFLNFSVGLFLFLSGMMSDVRKWNPQKRIYKVIIPYIIWSLFYVILANITTPSDIPLAYLKSIVTANAAEIMYYIFIYCEFTCLIPIIDKLSKSKYKYIAFIISPIEIILIRIIPLIIGYEIHNYINIIMRISCLGWFTYFYLGYMIGNESLKIKISTKKLIFILIGSIILQILAGYWYYSMGVENCGTQLKLSSILSGTIFMMIAYRFINSKIKANIKILHLLGDCSFGIYFSHLAIMSILKHFVPFFSKIFYPFNAIIVVIVSLLVVLAGKKILGKYSKYLAF